MKKLTLKKLTVSALNTTEQNQVLAGAGGYTYRPGGDCGRSERFTYVAACPETYVCGTGDECGGGGASGICSTPQVPCR